MGWVRVFIYTPSVGVVFNTLYLSVMEPGPHIGAICDTLLTLDGAADVLMCDKSYYHCKYYLFEGNKPLINLRSPHMPCGNALV